MGLLLLSGCSGPDAPKKAAPRVAGKSVQAPPVTFSVGASELRGSGTTLPLPPEIQSGVVATLDRYLADAVVGPLRTGAPPADLSPLFTELAWPRLSGPDRAAIVDEGVPAGSVTADAAVANLTGLQGADGAVALVGVHIDLRLRVGQLNVVRSGELVLVPEGDTWRIDGYDLRVSRDSIDGTATTVAAAVKS